MFTDKTDVWPVFLAWIVTFWVIIFIGLGVGFGPMGIIGGMSALSVLHLHGHSVGC
jgi:hypothetical protein